MASGKTTAGWVIGVLGVLLCLGCVGFVLLMGVVGPEGVGSEDWQRAFARDGGSDGGAP